MCKCFNGNKNNFIVKKKEKKRVTMQDRHLICTIMTHSPSISNTNKLENMMFYA